METGPVTPAPAATPIILHAYPVFSGSVSLIDLALSVVLVAIMASLTVYVYRSRR